MSQPPPFIAAYNLSEAEWEVLYLLCDALNQLRKLTLSFSELRYLAVEHTEEQIRTAVEALLKPPAGRPNAVLVIQISNLANLPIYRITPTGRQLVELHKQSAHS